MAKNNFFVGSTRRPILPTWIANYMYILQRTRFILPTCGFSREQKRISAQISVFLPSLQRLTVCRTHQMSLKDTTKTIHYNSSYSCTSWYNKHRKSFINPPSLIRPPFQGKEVIKHPPAPPPPLFWNDLSRHPCHFVENLIGKIGSLSSKYREK